MADIFSFGDYINVTNLEGQVSNLEALSSPARGETHEKTSALDSPTNREILKIRALEGKHQAVQQQNDNLQNTVTELNSAKDTLAAINKQHQERVRVLEKQLAETRFKMQQIRGPLERKIQGLEAQGREDRARLAKFQQSQVTLERELSSMALKLSALQGEESDTEASVDKVEVKEPEKAAFPGGHKDLRARVLRKFEMNAVASPNRFQALQKTASEDELMERFQSLSEVTRLRDLVTNLTERLEDSQLAVDAANAKKESVEAQLNHMRVRSDMEQETVRFALSMARCVKCGESAPVENPASPTSRSKPVERTTDLSDSDTVEPVAIKSPTQRKKKPLLSSPPPQKKQPLSSVKPTNNNKPSSPTTTSPNSTDEGGQVLVNDILDEVSDSGPAVSNPPSSEAATVAATPAAPVSEKITPVEFKQNREPRANPLIISPRARIESRRQKETPTDKYIRPQFIGQNALSVDVPVTPSVIKKPEVEKLEEAEPPKVTIGDLTRGQGESVANPTAVADEDLTNIAETPKEKPQVAAPERRKSPVSPLKANKIRSPLHLPKNLSPKRADTARQRTQEARGLFKDMPDKFQRSKSPIREAKVGPQAEELLNKTSPTLGLRIQAPEGDKPLQLPTRILITKIIPDGPADLADIKSGWHVVSIDGHKVNSHADFIKFALYTRPGTKLDVAVDTGSETKIHEIIVQAKEISSEDIKNLTRMANGDSEAGDKDILTNIHSKLKYFKQHGHQATGPKPKSKTTVSPTGRGAGSPTTPRYLWNTGASKRKANSKKKVVSKSPSLRFA